MGRPPRGQKAASLPQVTRSIEKYTKKSRTDGAVAIEQYVDKDAEDWQWQFWVRWQGHIQQLLDPEPADYAADFIFTSE